MCSTSSFNTIAINQSVNAEDNEFFPLHLGDQNLPTKAFKGCFTHVPRRVFNFELVP